jgi:TPR repeat protein
LFPCFFLLLFLSSQAREAAKSGLVLFHEAMEGLNVLGVYEHYYQRFASFERAAAKGNEEAIWIGSVVKDVGTEKGALHTAFVRTEMPLGWYCAGDISPYRSPQQFEFWKKSAEGGCSWGQVAYAEYFDLGRFVEKNLKVYFYWLKQAANQNNPQAMDWLGNWLRSDEWLRDESDRERALSYYRAAAELGWKDSMRSLGIMLQCGEGCAKDLGQAAMWSARGRSWIVFVEILKKSGRPAVITKMKGCDFDRLCYSLGWGVYWYLYQIPYWKNAISDENKDVCERYLDYYCSCVELQQKSIFTFLMCWNQTTGVKDIGSIIGKMVWEQREDNLVKSFEK